MKYSIIIKKGSIKNVLDDLRKIPSFYTFDNSLMYKDELIIDIEFNYEDRSKAIKTILEIESKYTPKNYL